MNAYSDVTLAKIEFVLDSLESKPLGSKKLLKQLETTQKKVRTQAIKNIFKPESIQNWKFYQTADSVTSWISYVPPRYILLSKALVQQLDTTTTIDYTPVFYHFWSHYEQAHFRKRSESTLVTEFGGASLAFAIEYDAFKAIRLLIVQNGGRLTGNAPSFPFSVEEEAEAEILASKAFKAGRKDSVLIGDVWKKINPDFKWADDFLKIHSGKIKMAK